MIDFSFTITPTLKKEIEKIDETRNKILIQLLSRAEELELRWESNLDRITYSSRLTPKKFTKAETLSVLNPIKTDGEYKMSKSEIKSYVNCYEWINQKWLMSKEKVKEDDIKKVIAFFPHKVNTKDTNIKQILDFVQINPEHPIVQSALVFALFYLSLPKDSDNIKLSFIISYIFLYKYGYDLRGLLNLEEFFSNDLDHFRNLINEGAANRNLSSYLEYFTQGVSISSEHALRKILNGERRHDLPASFYELSDRQREILMLFEKPGAKVSNKTVQKAFEVSQITASRDLAKLYALGLIFSAGKGRSVYYTRI
ncbi:MAG TPA: hypothetical protein VG917_01540 [Patescibacteria group bacterium]|nr:hypothetical protein [Patescibacteria group bacterium]